MPEPVRAPVRAADAEGDAEPGHRRHEDVEGGQPDHEQLRRLVAPQVAHAVGERVAPPFLGGAREPEARTYDEQQHRRDHHERGGVDEHHDDQTAPGDQDPAGRRAQQPHRAAADLVPALHRAQVVAGDDLADQGHPGRQRQPAGDPEGTRRSRAGSARRGPRRTSRAAPSTSTSGLAELAGDQQPARVVAVGEHAAEQHEQGLRQHLRAEHDAGHHRREGVRGGPGQGHVPGVVAEPRHPDGRQPGQHHRVAAYRRGRGADQLRVGRGRAHGRTGSLGKTRAIARTGRRSASGCVVGVVPCTPPTTRAPARRGARRSLAPGPRWPTRRCPTEFAAVRQPAVSVGARRSQSCIARTWNRRFSASAVWATRRPRVPSSKSSTLHVIERGLSRHQLSRVSWASSGAGSMRSCWCSTLRWWLTEPTASPVRAASCPTLAGPSTPSSSVSQRRSGWWKAIRRAASSSDGSRLRGGLGRRVEVPLGGGTTGHAASLVA